MDFYGSRASETEIWLIFRLHLLVVLNLLLKSNIMAWTIALQPQAAWVSVKRTVVMCILTLKHVTATIDYLSSTRQRHTVSPGNLSFPTNTHHSTLPARLRVVTCASSSEKWLALLKPATASQEVTLQRRSYSVLCWQGEEALVSRRAFHSSRGGRREGTAGGGAGGVAGLWFSPPSHHDLSSCYLLLTARLHC